MRSWLSLVWETTRVFLLFMGCTLLFYYGILWVSQEYENYHRYDEPQGRAVKVFHMDGEAGESKLLDRLFLFYHYGE
ncbi:YqzK family protein [Anaerobacillus sp. MEB173]|uniref:YqzK family protein n=1 Tax=Anaerobacillus sp. MEB173 TaxID=3383345 RepID=UPI003F92B98D